MDEEMKSCVTLCLGVATLLLLFAAQACAQTPFVVEPLTWEVWEALPADKNLATCTTTTCQTLKRLLDSAGQLDERDFPNSQTADAEKNEKPSAELPLVAFVKTSGEAGQEACRLLISLVGHMDDLTVLYHALELATLIEKDVPGCLGQVVAATPTDVDGMDVLEQALSLCEARGQPYCDRLRRSDAFFP